MARVGVERAVVALLMLTLCGSAYAQTCKSQQFIQTLDQYTSLQSYSVSMAERDFPFPRAPFKMLQGGGGDPTCRVQDKALRGFFPKGKILGYSTGFTFYSMLPKQLEEATMVYRVKFSPGFDWTRGGKLPGICGGEGAGGTHCPVGCSTVSRDRGFSIRLMWRANGRMVTYVYYPDKPGAIRCGEDWNWSEGVKSGVWHHVRLYVKMNTPGKRDGVFKAWLDDKLVNERDDVPWRYNPNFKLSRSYLTTYVGGSNPATFAPNQDQYIWFQDFEVSEGFCPPKSSPSSPSPSTPAPSPRPQSPPTSSGSTTSNPPKEVRGFVLYEGPGYDIPGNDVTDFQPSGTFEKNVLSCSNLCNKIGSCSLFTYYGGRCFLKQSSKDSPRKFDADPKLGLRYLYVLEGYKAPSPTPAPTPAPKPSPPPSPSPQPAPVPAPKPPASPPPAPSKVNGFLLYKQPGYNVPGNDVTQTSPTGTLERNLQSCANLCNKLGSCNLFVYKDGVCYLKRASSTRPVKASEAHYLYYSEDINLPAEAPAVPASPPTSASPPVVPPVSSPVPTPNPPASVPVTPPASGLKVSYTKRSEFFGGVCLDIILENTSSELCQNWQLNLDLTNASRFNKGRTRVWGLTETSDGTGFVADDPSVSTIAPKSKVQGRIGGCFYFSPKSPGPTDAQFDEWVGLAASCS